MKPEYSCISENTASSDLKEEARNGHCFACKEFEIAVKMNTQKFLTYLGMY